jgi:Helix-turn-helix domain
MTKKELERLKAVEQIRQGKLTYNKGASQLGISERQLYRSMERYREEGDEGLTHRLRGATSNRRYTLKVHKNVVELYRSHYGDYGPTLFNEALSERHSIMLGVETLRQWLIGAGLWKKARKGRRHRKKRERRSAIGEMIQFDGSYHKWFEDRGPESCLLVAVDDASGRVILRFVDTESIQEVLSFWRRYVETIGIPKQVYTDYHSVYYNTRNENKTDYGLSMEDLGVECLYASSPQAKGRVERMNRTLQDRLLKALRQEGIDNIDEANRFVESRFLAKFNAQFVHPCGEDGIELENHHRQCVYTSQELDRIFSFRSERRVYNDSTITLDSRWIQLTSDKAPLPPPRTKVYLRRYLDGKLHIFWQGGELGYRMMPKYPRPEKQIRLHSPGPDHPWHHKAPFGKAKKRKRSKAEVTSLALRARFVTSGSS